MPREWDAATYDRLPLPHLRWGANAIARLELTGDERVLDAGCGTGRVTEGLLERLPRGCVVALDGSQAMLDQLRVRLAPVMDRVELVYADLTQPLPLREPVDAILSIATLHWLPDHATVFKNLAAVLRPGGQFVAECGGTGNAATVRDALHALGLERVGIWNFPGPQETQTLLEAAGFVDVRTWLTPDPASLAPGEELETYLSTVVLGAHLDTIPAEERQDVVRAVAERLPRPEVDYVRLNMVARKVQLPI